MNKDKPPMTPWWGTAISIIGVPTFILLWLLGAFEGWLASPVNAQIREHDKNTAKYLRQICLALWRDDPGNCD